MWAFAVQAVTVVMAEEGREAALRRDLAFDMARGRDAHRRLMEALGTTTTNPSRKGYDCVGCGAPLFGVMNENCQYCKRPAAM